jgi:hypothetical protein
VFGVVNRDASNLYFVQRQRRNRLPLMLFLRQYVCPVFNTFILWSKTMLTKLFAGLFLSLGLVFGGAPGADKAGPQDCCAQNLACCGEHSACCVATAKLDCCAQGLECCITGEACCGAPVTKEASRKNEAKECCVQGQGCCAK